MAKATLVARDLAPSRTLDLVKADLSAKGVTVSAYLGHGKPLASSAEQVSVDVRNSQCLFLGMSCSSDLAKEEIASAKEAIVAGVPYGFYADTFGTSSRAWFEPLREKARFVFVMSEEEAKATRRLFPNAEVVASGNPVLEEPFFFSGSPAETRRLLSMSAEDLLLYCTAGKDLEVNRAHFSAVMQAVSRLEDWRRWKIFFMLHPGDQNSPTAYQDILSGDEGERVVARLMPAQDLKAMGLKSLDMIAVCDLMVAAVSTAGIEAACLRKPVIDFFSPAGLKRMKEQTGSDVWPPCEFGISRPVMGDSIELSRAIQDLMAPGGFNAMRARQKACFPAPKERGAAVRIMTEVLTKLLS